MTVILRDYGHTKRCHALKTVHTQTVAEHSHGVALLCTQLYGGRPSTSLLLAALYHDLPECVTGDVPATAKWRSKELADALDFAETEFHVDNGTGVDLSPEENLVLKAADLLDLGFYCIDELMYGNKHVMSMMQNVISALARLMSISDFPSEVVGNLLDIHNEMMRRYRELCK